MGQKLVKSFVMAWVCTIAKERELLGNDSFKRVKFGIGTINALVQPDWRDMELRHFGLFEWLRHSFDGRIEKEGTVTLLVLDDADKVMEFYQLKLIKQPSNAVADVDEECLMRKAECILRTLRLRIACMGDKNSACNVRVRFTTARETEIKRDGERHGEPGERSELGSLELANWVLKACVWQPNV